MRTEINKEIEAVSKAADPLKILASADTMKVLGVQRPLLQVRNIEHHVVSFLYVYIFLLLSRSFYVMHIKLRLSHTQCVYLCGSSTYPHVSSQRKKNPKTDPHYLFVWHRFPFVPLFNGGGLSWVHSPCSFLWSLLVQGQTHTHTNTETHLHTHTLSPSLFLSQIIMVTMPPISQDHNCGWNSAWSFLSL